MKHSGTHQEERFLQSKHWSVSNNRPIPGEVVRFFDEIHRHPRGANSEIGLQS